MVVVKDQFRRVRHSLKHTLGAYWMNREFLEKLGLDKSVVDSIMTEHGKSVQDVNNQLDSAKNELEQSKQTVSDLTSTNEKLSTDLNDLKSKDLNAEQLQSKLDNITNEYEQSKADNATKIDHLQKNNLIKTAALKSGAKDENDVLNLFTNATSLDDLSVKDGKIEGLGDKLNKFKEDKPYLFNQEPKKPDEPKPFNPGNPQGDTGDNETSALEKALGIRSTK